MMEKLEFITPYEVERMFKITRPTQIAWRKAGYLPKPLRLGRRVYYKVSDIENLQTK